MKKQHADTTTESELSILLDMCERPAASDERDKCPLCLEELALLGLRSHIAAHLEDLALFVLPVGVDENSRDIDSGIAKRPQQKRSVLYDDELSSLSSSSEVKAAGNPSPNAADFIKLTATKSHSVQVDSWVRTSKEQAASESYMQTTHRNDSEVDETVPQSSASENQDVTGRLQRRNSVAELMLNNIAKDYYNTFASECTNFISNPPSEE